MIFVGVVGQEVVSGESGKICPRCSYQHPILDTKENDVTFFCVRCGLYSENNDVGVRDEENAGASSYRWKGSGVSMFGGFKDLIPFVEWAAKNREELRSATYTMMDEGSWYLVDALTGENMVFPDGEHLSMVERVLWRGGDVFE